MDCLSTCCHLCAECVEVKPKKYRKPRARTRRAFTLGEATREGKCPIVLRGVSWWPGSVIQIEDELIQLGDILGIHGNNLIYAMKKRNFQVAR